MSQTADLWATLVHVCAVTGPSLYVTKHQHKYSTVNSTKEVSGIAEKPMSIYRASI